MTGPVPPEASDGAPRIPSAGPVVRAGSIYDLGYRRYEGPRLGRAHAVRSLIVHSFRTTYGLGRTGRAKVAPIVFGAMAIMPAVIVVGVLTIAARFGVEREFDDAGLVGYSTYFGSVSVIIGLFCAAQAPELFGRDQRHEVLALYFARALRRTDYALARLFGFALAVLVLLLFPMAILFLGRILLSADVAGAIGRNLPNIPPIVAQALVIAGLLGGLAMAVSAWTPRRSYATAGIIALFVLPGLVAGIVIGLGSSAIGTWLVLLSPNTVLEGTNALFFGESLGGEFFFFDLPLWMFLVSALVGIVAVTLLVVRRFGRIAT